MSRQLCSFDSGWRRSALVLDFAIQVSLQVYTPQDWLEEETVSDHGRGVILTTVLINCWIGGVLREVSLGPMVIP